MPKKKGHKKNANPDFTINDCANAVKPVSRIKKSTVTEAVTPELSWDQIDDDVDIVEETNPDGTKNFVYKKRQNHSKSEQDITHHGIEYPEIVWYLISHYIKPEEVGTFACINKATYAITKRESFWRTLYKRYCENHPRLPERLRIENSYKTYGLRQRVIRALYHTHGVFVNRVVQQFSFIDTKPYDLIKRLCVNVWYRKGPTYWSIYFKFKRLYPHGGSETSKFDFFNELGRIDANPEENVQVLQVSCQSFYEVPPLMGMTLTSVCLVLSQGFHHHCLHLGFNKGHHVSRDVLPECTVILDRVVNMYVFDWWHPRYPHFDNRLPVADEESLPVLKKDFFS